MPADRVSTLGHRQTDVPGYENIIKASLEDASSASTVRKRVPRAAFAVDRRNAVVNSACSERAIIQDYFEKLKELNDKYGEIPPEHIWNMDEKGVRMVRGHLNGPTGKKHNFLRTCKNPDCGSVDNMKLVSITECVSAAGVSLRPSFLLPKGPYPHPDVLEGAPFGCIGQSGTGWTDDEIDELWLTQFFITQAYGHRVCDDKPIILTLDGREPNATGVKVNVHSNMSGVEFILLRLPHKCLHKLHPLDVAAFKTIQADWKENCLRRTTEDFTIDRYNIIPQFRAARKCITPELIKKAFRDTGIYAVDPSIHFAEGDQGPPAPGSHVPAIPAAIPPAPAPMDDEILARDLEDVKVPVHGITAGSASGAPSSSDASHNNQASIQEGTATSSAASRRVSPPCTGCPVHAGSSSSTSIVPWSEDEKLDRGELLVQLRSARQQLFSSHREKEDYKPQLGASNAQYVLLKDELGEAMARLANLSKEKKFT